ncbi:hypothetical protein VDGE_09607 [Verticillium dahliae]|uniref:Xylanolytic transcriptional activator regulatory domain-containing protein n=1 Tax=Verticillium dahliae TaxID=27337 RepID=A0A444RMM4_VERDA|nr:hypothetical protein VDGE_09607 [Verticillium dahliae]
MKPPSQGTHSPTGSTTPGSRAGADPREPRPHPRPGPATITTSPSVIDSMTAVVDEGTSTREFFGSSSAGSFTAQIKRAIDARLGKANGGPFRQAAPSRSSLSMMSTHSAKHPASDVSYVLPPRRQADHLMDLYWFYVDPLYPFLNRQRWNQTYNAIFAGGAIDADERIFMASLNVIFALSTQLLEASTPEQREEQSSVYFQRAQALLPMNPWDAGSIDLVQCLLLTSQYLQSTDHPHQTWMVVGSAIRTAQGLGLHLPETSGDRTDLGERELLRRIWYGCVLMDRMVSVTHGRPAMISGHLATTVPLPMSSASSVNGTEAALSGGAVHAAFFVKSVQLYEIIHRTIIAFYGGTMGCSKSKQSQGSDSGSSDGDDDDFDKVVQLDRSLSHWEQRLPVHLRWTSLVDTADEVSRRQTVILRMRFLHARILLLRPVLSRFCLAPPTRAVTFGLTDSLQARVVEQGALFCVSTAQNMIAVLLEHQTSDNTIGLLPAWWYRVYYVYSAATVLIAAKLRPEIFPAVEIGRSWSQAMAVLKSHERFAPGAAHSGLASRGRSLGEGETGVHPDFDASTQPIPDIQQQLVDEFAPPLADLGELDLAEFNFDVNDLSWLNDMHATWEFLNE